ncbi:MAG: anthrax toxin-like adenylyl cyclase domain-containing protein [Pyrinomonadaceae bacterium]
MKPISEQESGIVDTHAIAIAKTASEQNTFIFVRPTEYDSTILIRAGYATKSMDVHHKSSNWGPMAGFVPCDPAFSKKCEGTPNPHEHEHKHAAAHPVQLSLKPELLAEHQKIEFQPGYLLAPADGTDRLAVPYIAKRLKTESAVGGARAKFEAFQTGGHLPEHKFCTAKPTDFGNKSTLFCLIQKAGQWLVYWVQWDGEVGRLNPLRVFGYPQNGSLNPVTGDYDLWMVAPHFSRFDAHAATRLEKDVHGESAASPFTLSLITKMNASCGRSENPVFNHGAEAQNYGFTQALDWNLAMFTPGGGSYMVRMNEMGAILGDLQKGGYLVVVNKRYGETDPRLMNTADKRGIPALSEIRSGLDNLFKELEEIKRTANAGQVAKHVQSTAAAGQAQMPGMMKHEIGVMAQRMQAQRALGTEQSRIYRFHKSLLDFLGSQTTQYQTLTGADFPPGSKTYEMQAMALHRDLQQVLVSATTGSGQSDAKLGDWLRSHQPQLDQLKSYWK